MEIVAAIAPVFAVMALGHLLARADLPGGDFWVQADRLVYWVLLPMMLFHTNSTLSFSGELALGFAVVLIVGFYGVAGLTFLICRAAGIAPAGTGAVLQGAVRHNSFTALAICESLFGREGLELAALAMSILALVTNMSVVPILVALAPRPPGIRVARKVLTDTATNPIIIGIVAGLVMNLITDGPIGGLHDVTGLVAQAALPMMLLCVGASLSFAGTRGRLFPIAVSMLGKFILFPALVVVMAAWMSIEGTAIFVLLVFAAISTASAGLALARQMGADVALMSAIIAAQAIVVVATLPLSIALLRATLGHM